MGDDSRSIVKSLKNELSMLLEVFQTENKDEAQQEHGLDFLEEMDSEEVHDAIKVLSQQRRALNQKLESVQKELDLNVAKLESLKLAKADFSDVEKRIQELSDLGAAVSENLENVDKELRNYRVREDELQAEFLESI